MAALFPRERINIQSRRLLLRNEVQHLLLYFLVSYPRKTDDHPFPRQKGILRSELPFLVLEKCTQCLEREIGLSPETEVLYARASSTDTAFLDKCSQEAISITVRN